MTILPITTSPNPIMRIAAFTPYVATLLVLIYALTGDGYLASVLGFALIYTVFVTGLNIFMGYTGQVSFGQNAFAAIGGYSSAWLSVTMEWEPLVGLVIGCCLSVAAAILIGYPTLRLKGHYLAMGTLAIGLIVYEIAIQWEDVTGGYTGISGIAPLGIGDYQANTDNQKLVVLAIIAGTGLLMSRFIRQSRLGRAFAAIAGSENAALALGINVSRYKLVAFVIAALYASVSGWLFVHVVGYVSPEVFGLHMVNLGFTMLYVGGLGSSLGPLIGAVIISLLPETFRAFKDYQDLFYGTTLIVILIYAPNGLASIGSFLTEKLRSGR
ncbi:branched-chain amino acid ABC transporter permease [Phyllobacterium sp. SB3]|uniref:branched-chain amino acid ABC transporter permease n=1 Tax=Phyllobacterium sp. SB3 TaxID=3156073 RepID=UPI0032AEB5CA